MEPFHTETTVRSDRSVTVVDVPYAAGQQVEVIVLPHLAPPASGRTESLRGLPVTYLDPTEPVSAEDWEANS